MATNKKNQIESNSLAIAAFVLSFFIPLIGLILAIISLTKINKNPKLDGKNISVAAIVISAVLMIIYTVVIGGVIMFTTVNIMG